MTRKDRFGHQLCRVVAEAMRMRSLLEKTCQSITGFDNDSLSCHVLEARLEKLEALFKTLKAEMLPCFQIARFEPQCSTRIALDPAIYADTIEKLRAFWAAHEYAVAEARAHNAEHPFQNDQRKIPLPDYTELGMLMSLLEVPF